MAVVEESDQLVSEMEEWKEVVGNAATICTIVQFLVGAQVCNVGKIKPQNSPALKFRFVWDIIEPSLLEKAPS